MKRKARSLPAGPAGVNAGARRERRFSPRLQRDSPPPRPPPTPLTGCGCNDTGDPVGRRGRTAVAGAGRAGLARGTGRAGASATTAAGATAARPPAGRASACAHVPVGHGVVMHSMLSEVQPHASAVSAVQEVTSVCAVQGSAGGVVPQPHGAQAAPAGQAGQPQTATGAEPVLTDAVPDPPPQPAPRASSWSWSRRCCRRSCRPGTPRPPDTRGSCRCRFRVRRQRPSRRRFPSRRRSRVPPPVAPPLQPPPGWPQAQSQTGQTSPAAQAGQSQVQVPPPPALPPSAACGGGQSHCTGGQLPFAGQASGCTQRQPFTADPRSKQKPPPSQL